MRPTITAFNWVPPFAEGQVRDLRVRWALEEVGQPYDVHYLSQGEQKQPSHRDRQPFGQVPTYQEGDLTLFESGAIVLHIAQTHGGLLPDDAAGRARAMEWAFAALNSVEPPIMDLALVDLFEADKPWSAPRRPAVEERIHERLRDLSARLGTREWLDGDAFTAGDLLMAAVLRIVEDDAMLDPYDNLSAYVQRATARPAFERALADQMAGFTGTAPPGFAEWAEKMKQKSGRAGVTYIQGFVIAVKTDRKADYLKMARISAPMFAEFGATRTVECWAEDVPEGKRTDYRKATKAEAGEAIVFSWIEWPDKATCEAGAARMQTDERMQMVPEDMPFDGARMVYAGFDAVHDSGDAGAFGYVDGVVAKVPSGDRHAVAAFEAAATPVFKDKGALRLVGAVASDIAPGKNTDFLRAVDASEGDMITFGWIEWPDKATRDAGMAGLMQDERMAALTPAWEGPTAIFGGFVPILDTAHAEASGAAA